MQCYVYRSRRKPGSFLFLPEKDNFTQVPEVLLKIFGEPEFSFDFDLSVDRTLMIKAETPEVRRVIRENGFFLQLPPNEELAC
ncbi:MAG: YcgL domain-containing protein [Thiothrix sp.]|jgi:uncharacterized protein YcgL (UPF0745 family)|uniref:YcgL domain-containing protein n=1 Tax=Thiothrix sp. TaxID=1032 RepID=UPI00262D7BE6|nr:YcgL domain-containing protein [Thiothrix sp.]MDD5393538.1 YcgL domain-containing protein [Thiothrix sp.]